LPLPSSYTTVCMIPYTVGSHNTFEPLKVVPQQYRTQPIKEPFRQGLRLRCDAPMFHQGPRPFWALAHALTSPKPNRIRFFAHV
jgi:hypothetical protein